MTGTVSEMETRGGELAFVCGLVRDSKALRTRILWYTSMLGKRASVAPVTREIRRAGATAVVVTSFTQGRTARWAVAWTFHAGVAEGTVRAAVETGGSVVLRLDGKKRKRRRSSQEAESSFVVDAVGVEETRNRVCEACRCEAPTGASSSSGSSGSGSSRTSPSRIVVEDRGEKYTITLAMADGGGGGGKSTLVQVRCCTGHAGPHHPAHFDQFAAKLKADVQRTNRRWRRRRGEYHPNCNNGKAAKQIIALNVATND